MPEAEGAGDEAGLRGGLMNAGAVSVGRARAAEADVTEAEVGAGVGVGSGSVDTGAGAGGAGAGVDVGDGTGAGVGVGAGIRGGRFEMGHFLLVVNVGGELNLGGGRSRGPDSPSELDVSSKLAKMEDSVGLGASVEGDAAIEAGAGPEGPTE